MKFKRSKKFYTYTSKHKQKAHSERYGRWNGCPHWYTRTFNVTFRRECKRITKRNWEENKEIPYPIPGRNVAKWYWW